MTIRKKEPEDEPGGLMEVVDRTIGTKSFRIAIFCLLLSMHPLGRQILGTVGFEFPDEKKLAVVADEAKNAKTELSQIAETVKELKTDVSSIKANNAIINAKVDSLERTFQGFQIDFKKHRAPDAPPVP